MSDGPGGGEDAADAVRTGGTDAGVAGDHDGAFDGESNDRARGEANETPSIPWSRLDLDELEAVYWRHLAPERERQGYDPAVDRPSYRWLVDNGFGGIQYALREHHDTTVKAFFVDELGIGGDDTGFRWGIESDETRAVLEEYVDDLTRRRGLAESTIASKRARLATYVRTYADVHGEANVRARVATPGERPTEIRRVLDALDAVGDGLSTDAARLEYLGDVRRFYAYLERRGYAAYNPLSGADEEFAWQRTPPDNRSLSAEQVRRLYATAADTGERLLVVGLAGWGLRPSELAALHRSNVDLDVDDPHLAFDDRKNGPGTVALIYGLDDLAARLDTLRCDTGWNGYLFPSKRASAGHRVADTIRRRFVSLAERADVRVDGEVPTPKTGRRFWYATYLDATATMRDQLAAVADEQGSASADVVLRNYLSEPHRRRARRRYMRRALASAFE